jgi:hypothetical protein
MLWTCGASARHIPAQGGELGRGGDRQKTKSMQKHRSSVHRLILLFIKQPRRYGASVASGLPIMSPNPSDIRLSADYHQCQCPHKPSSMPIFYDYSPSIVYARPLAATEL